MLAHVVKRMAQKMVRRLGFEIRRIDGIPSRTSIDDMLRHVHARGFKPATVVDVGAALGQFTTQCHAWFPEAHYVLLEPLEEYRSCLDRVVQAIPRATYAMVAASSKAADLRLNVHTDLVGSSLYREVEQDSGVNGRPRVVPAVPLDDLLASKRVPSPFLIKIDVQGAELDVLAGSQATLQAAEYVILEVSCFRFFEQGPVLSDIVAYMQTKGFVAYDLAELRYRPLDQALAQVDIAFVKDAGYFRQEHHYATPEQRAKQNQLLADYVRGAGLRR